jgi:hypothetical protein
MSSKRKTPKKKLYEDPLFQAVNQFVKPRKISVSLERKTPKRKTPKNKTPKQKGGQEDNFLNKIQDMLFTMNHVDYNGIGISTTFTPLDGNKDNSDKIFTEITQKGINTSKNKRICKGVQIGGRAIHITEELEDGEKIAKGGYGKKYINNHVRLHEGPQSLYVHSSL